MKKYTTEKTKVSLPAKQKTKVVKEQTATTVWLLLGAIVLLTAYAFWPILQNGFTNWDDPTYLENNPLIKELSGATIKRIFSEVYFANYQPLHILSYAIEYHFFKLNPAGYHGVSLAMHLINLLLVFFFIRKLSSNDIIALITTALFAVNALHVESVAWAAERKDLLYAMFFFAALLSYLHYVIDEKNKGKIKYLGFTFLFFVLAIFSKAMAASLVPVLFLIDFYVNRKFDGKVYLEKIPFLILAIIMGLVSVNASASEGSIDNTSSFSFIDRLFFASHNLLQYIIKSIIPFKQSAFYQYPETVSFEYYFAGIVAIGLAVYTFYSLKKNKVFFFATTFYVITVFLVLMLIPVGPTIFSERYSYIPSVALFYLIAFYLDALLIKNQTLRMPVFIGIGIIALISTYYTRQRCIIWKDSITLWTDVLQQFPNAPHALNNRGDAFFNTQQLDLAIADFTNAIQYNDKYAQAYYNRGNAYGQSGKTKEAFDDLNKAIEYDATNANAFNKRGQSNAVLGNTNAAISDFNKALVLKPDLTEVYYNLGITYINTNQKELACANLKIAVDAGFELAVKPYSDICGK